MEATVDGTATSRVDNTTPLCTKCEQAEAIEDYQGILMPKSEWVYTRMCKDFGIGGDAA
jgi:hypothetical protein